MRSATSQSVLNRAFGVLGAFGPDRPELTLDELCAHTGQARTTVHRLASQLVAEGALERSRRGWKLGTRMFELGQLVSREQRLREQSLAYMQDLYAATGEMVQLAVLDAGTVLYVEIIAGHRRVASPSRRGGRMPLHCTALGKALLAFSADAGRGVLQARPTLDARTPNSITDIGALREELHRVRAAQVAFDHEEAALGLQCVAAPILDANGIARAALSVSMPTAGRLTLSEATPAVRAVARAFSRDDRYSMGTNPLGDPGHSRS